MSLMKKNVESRGSVIQASPPWAWSEVGYGAPATRPASRQRSLLELGGQFRPLVHEISCHLTTQYEHLCHDNRNLFNEASRNLSAHNIFIVSASKFAAFAQHVPQEMIDTSA